MVKPINVSKNTQTFYSDLISARNENVILFIFLQRQKLKILQNSTSRGLNKNAAVFITFIFYLHLFYT